MWEFREVGPLPTGRLTMTMTDTPLSSPVLQVEILLSPAELMAATETPEQFFIDAVAGFRCDSLDANTPVQDSVPRLNLLPYAEQSKT